MSNNWYYVESNERVGPVDEKEFMSLIDRSVIKKSSYVWKKGLDNWVQAKNLDELKHLLKEEDDFELSDLDNEINKEYNDDNSDPINGSFDNEIMESGASEEGEIIHFDWDMVNEDEQIFILKIGEDRGGEDKEYGPFSVTMIRKLISDNRINQKTQLFSAGMSEWSFIGNIDYFSELFPGDERFEDRRTSRRCPISARVFLSDDSSFFQGVCRDISIGGAQVLVANFPGSVGDLVKVNMHFEDGSFAFTANGKITRLLNHVGGFAMRYIELSSSAIRMINSYVENYED